MKGYTQTPQYIVCENSIDGKDYAIQGKYKKNLDKYVSWYGKLKKSPPDIMVTGFPISINNKNGLITVDTSNPVILRVKDLENAWLTIADDTKKKNPRIPKF